MRASRGSTLGTSPRAGGLTTGLERKAAASTILVLSASKDGHAHQPWFDGLTTELEGDVAREGLGLGVGWVERQR